MRTYYPNYQIVHSATNCCQTVSYGRKLDFKGLGFIIRIRFVYYLINTINWLASQDSNLGQRSQSPLCYHYTTRQDFTLNYSIYSYIVAMQLIITGNRENTT